MCSAAPTSRRPTAPTRWTCSTGSPLECPPLATPRSSSSARRRPRVAGRLAQRSAGPGAQRGRRRGWRPQAGRGALRRRWPRRASGRGLAGASPTGERNGPDPRRLPADRRRPRPGAGRRPSSPTTCPTGPGVAAAAARFRGGRPRAWPPACTSTAAASWLRTAGHRQDHPSLERPARQPALHRAGHALESAALRSSSPPASTSSPCCSADEWFRCCAWRLPGKDEFGAGETANGT